MLTPLGPSTVTLTTVLDLPPSELPAQAEVADKALRLTVLVPAHDEAVTIEATFRPDKITGPGHRHRR